MQESNRNPLKVLFLSAWYPNEQDSMFGLFVKKHAVAVSRKCNVMVLYACADKNATSKYRITENKENNLNEIHVYYKEASSGKTKKLINFFRWIKAYQTAYTIMKKKWGQPQIIHANILTRIPVLALYLKYTRNIPYIITEHWSRYLESHNTFHNILHQRLTKLAISKSSELTVVSDLLGKSMINKKVCNAYTLLPNVIDTNLFKIRENKESAHVKTLLHISCFEERSKNMSGVLHTIKLLSEKRDDFVLRMVGWGMNYQQTVELADKLGLLDRFVVFEGLKEGNDLASIISEADLTVLFSNYETFGIVVYESLSCGIPVMVSDVADFKKLIGTEYGIVANNNQPENLAKSLNNLLDRLSDYAPEKLRNFAVANFSEEVVCNKILNIYKNAINSR